MTLEEAIAAISHLIDDRDQFKKIIDKKPTIVFGQGKYLDEAVRILERHQMTDINIQKALAESGLLKILEEHAGEFGDGVFKLIDYPEIVTFVRLMEKTNETT